MLRHDVVGTEGPGRGVGVGSFLESLRAVSLMSTLFAGPSLPMHNRGQSGWMPLSGLQGYALHSAAVRGTPASQALSPRSSLLMSLNSGNGRFGGFGG